MPSGSPVECPGRGPAPTFVLVWFAFVLFLVSGFLFCVVQSGMGVSSQRLFLETGGVEGEGTELPQRRGAGGLSSLSSLCAQRTSKGGSAVQVSWDAAS